MKQQAIWMIAGMLVIAVLMTVISWNPLPLIVIGAASYVTWQVAKGLDG
jgi:uncharacterized protein (DUF2062 family)